MYRSNYDKFPAVAIEGEIFKGWDSILAELSDKIKATGKDKVVMTVECYQGVYNAELTREFQKLSPKCFLDTSSLMKSEEEIRTMTWPDVTDDAIFGYMTRLSIQDFFDKAKVSEAKHKVMDQTGVAIVYGCGASLIVPDADIIVYADMPRWELQLRQRRHEVDGIGVNNRNESPASQYKRGFFVDWRVCDKLKKELFTKADYWLDTTNAENPKMILASVMLQGLENTSQRPFRVVPFFDPGPWGGQWMKKVCDLDRSQANFAWCFDCVPEENSLLLKVVETKKDGNLSDPSVNENDNVAEVGTLFEIPSINLVFYKTRALLGEAVESRFGQEFPIRFDFLDTIQGGNLSLQVHPTTQYIRDQFGMQYTQDESYYLLDADDDATVYLGLKTGIDKDEMIASLNESQNTGKSFDAEKFVNRFPAHKHDHFLIPNGTIHCSGKNAMVLEISATPYIFTFKLWDWGRLGLDGKPRPINIGHGSHVIQWERNTEYCKAKLVGQVTEVARGDGWREERTGLHANEFIETRRHWFTKAVEHDTAGGVNVLNLVEGREAIIESPEGRFEPFVVHYAETFIIPASVGRYTIRPYGESEGKECATIKAYVRFKQ